MGKHGTEYARVARDFYPTPAWVVEALAEHIELTGLRVWECACGDGRMVEVLKAAGATVYATDIEDRGYSGFDGKLDFLSAINGKPSFDYGAVITNPAYGERNKLAEKFAEVGLQRIAGGGLLALLLPNDFDSAVTRRYLFADCPAFAGKIVLTKRIIWFEPLPGKCAGPKENPFVVYLAASLSTRATEDLLRAAVQWSGLMKEQVRHRYQPVPARESVRRERQHRRRGEIERETALQAAFLRALYRWAAHAARHADDDVTPIVIPSSGTATVGELTRVVLAIASLRSARGRQ